MNRIGFCIVLLLTPVLGLWCYGWYRKTDAVHSDLRQIGIAYQSEEWNQITAVSKHQVRLVAVPLAMAYGIALAGWGITLRRRSGDKST